MKNLAGKTAFITGGASGMGLAMARSFSASGMKVVIADIEANVLNSALEEFAQSNAEVVGFEVDVTDRAAMREAADFTESTFGKVHVLVNNAGVAVGGNIDSMSYKDWDWVMGVNLDGVINGVQTFVSRIKSHGEGGHIVNTASMAGLMPVPGLSVYNTSKFAVVGMSEALRVDLADARIGVSVLCPGVVNTNIFESGRNRPQQLQAETDTAAGLLNTNLPESERAARLEAMLETSLDAAAVGDMVLHAIQTDEFYIFTHPQFGSIIASRGEEMADSIKRWQTYRAEHDID